MALQGKIDDYHNHAAGHDNDHGGEDHDDDPAADDVELMLMMLSWPAAHFAAGDREVESLLLGITLTLLCTASHPSHSHSHCC